MSESSQAALQNIVDFVNAQKNLSLSQSELHFDAPELVDPTVLTLITPNRRNSRVKVYFDGDLKQTAFDFNAHYNRLQLGRLFAMSSTYFQDDGETTIYELLPKLSAACKFQFTEDDVDNGEFGENGAFILRAKPGSYGVFGSVALSMGNDPAPPWFSERQRHYLTVREASIVEDADGAQVVLEQGEQTDPLYVATYDDSELRSIYHEFSNLSDLEFDGGLVYAVPPNGRTYTCEVDSYEDYPKVLQYIGSNSNGLVYAGDLNEIEATDTSKRYAVSLPSAPDVLNFEPLAYLYWLRFRHPDFPQPISFILRKES
ncbi:hypothetical protein [Xanthomonas phage RTH11]|nr:hypothetical protein [Xanthomonas phage RTH11]